MDIKEAYKVMQEASGIEVGDKVKVLRKFTSSEMGCDISWFNSKATYIGGEFIVKRLSPREIKLDIKSAGNCLYPFFVLEIIEKVKPEKMIMVDGKEYSEATLKLAMQEYSK